MSLISNALRTKEKERAASRAESARESQPLIDGFFPYVSTDVKGPRSRLVPALIVSGVVGLLAVIALIWSRPEQAQSGASQAPVVTPKTAIITRSQATDTIGPRTAPASETGSAVRSPGVNDGVASQLARGERPSGSTRNSGSDPANRVAVAPAQEAPVSAVASIPRPPTRENQPVTPRVDHELEATMAFNAGDLATARDKFLLATRFAPTARAWTNYGVTLQRLGDTDGAASAYQSAIGIDANYLEAWLYQGRLASDRGDMGKAIPLFQRARAINPRHAEVNIELARLEYDAGNWTDARRFAEEATRGDPANSRGHWYFAVASDQLKDSDAAIRGYSSYLRAVAGAEREQPQFVGYARERIAFLRERP